MSNKEARHLANVMQGTSHITTIDLNDNHIGTEGAVSLARVLFDNSSIEEFTLSKNLIMGTAAKAFSEVLRNNMTLQILDLSNNRVRNFGAVAIAQMLRTNCSLRKLLLRQNEIGNEGVEALAESLKFNNSLKTLELSGNPITDKGGAHLAHVLPHNSSLWHLSVARCRIGDKGAFALATSLEIIAAREDSCLQVIVLGPGNAFTDKGKAALSRVLTDESVLRRHATSDGTSSSTDTLGAAGQPVYSLRINRRLTICGLPSGADGTRALYTSILQFDTTTTEMSPLRSLRSLEISHSLLDDEVVKTLALMLSEGDRMEQLVELKISNNGPCSGTRLEPLAAALAKNETIKRLHVADVCMSGTHLRCVKSIVQANRSIAELRLINCMIGDEEAKALCAVVNAKTTIRVLDLSANYIAAKGARAIADMLETYSPLRVLDLSKNASLGDRGADALGNAMRSNMGLEVLDVSGCGITDDGMDGLAAAVMSLMGSGANLRLLRFHDNKGTTETGHNVMGLALQMANMKLDKMMPREAQIHYNKMKQIDDEQLKKQKRTVKSGLDGPEARKDIVDLQRQMCMLIRSCHGRALSDKTARADLRKRVRDTKRKIRKIVANEVARIGQLTAARTEYYRIAGVRWNLLEDIEVDNSFTAPHVQPRGFEQHSTTDTENDFETSNSLVDVLGLDGDGNACEGSDDDEHNHHHHHHHGNGDSNNTETDDTKVDATDATLLAHQMSARGYSLYFKVILESIVSQLNRIASIHNLGLESAGNVLLEFDDTLVIDGKRAILSFGPIKKIERATVKAAEKQEMIEDGELAAEAKSSSSSVSRKLTGADYVLDWVRATIVAEDPYILYVIFIMLRENPVLTIQRTKNKFFDSTYPTNIRTNVLINLLLLYPNTREEFKMYDRRMRMSSGGWSSLGNDAFDDKMAGKPIHSCEVQLTLQDFLKIKKLMHSYYAIERSSDPAFILKHPLFMDASCVEEVPQFVKDLNLSRASPSVKPRPGNIMIPPRSIHTSDSDDGVLSISDIIAERDTPRSSLRKAIREKFAAVTPSPSPSPGRRAGHDGLRSFASSGESSVNSDVSEVLSRGGNATPSPTPPSDTFASSGKLRKPSLKQLLHHRFGIGSPSGSLSSTSVKTSFDASNLRVRAKGFLRKRNRHLSMFHKRWKRRYFALVESTLYWWETQDDYLIGEAYLGELKCVGMVSKVEPVPSSAGARTKDGSFYFSVKPASKDTSQAALWLAAHSPTERSHWLEALSYVCARYSRTPSSVSPGL